MKAPASQFYFSDYMRDTRILSLQARGAWMDILCIMWFADERGRCNADVTQMKRLWGVEIDTAKAVLDEIITCKICDVETDCNGNVTLINRRMVRDENERNLTKLRVKRFREKKDVTQMKRKCNVVSSSSSSSSNNKKHIRKAAVFASDGFEKFWKEYPKKKSIGDAEKAWQKINPGEHLIDEILSAVQRAKTSEDWSKDDGKYIPYPATWLNRKGWLDEYTASKSVDTEDYITAAFEGRL